jgi:diketogulonate reductase-like aldo/keto reductase
MPRIIYGTAWKKEATEELVARAIGEGFRGIDTACQPRHYNEAGVGRGIARSLAGNGSGGGGLARADLFVQSKYSPLNAQDPERLPYDAAAPVAEQVAQSFAKSLENLGTDYLDSLVLHAPLASFAETLAAWRALETIAATGGVRRLGVSNFYSLAMLEALYETAEVKPSAVQNRFYRDTGYDVDIRRFCRERDIAYQSFWTLTANGHLLGHELVLAIASRHARTPEQVLYRYLAHESVVPLTGTTSVAHMREDLAIFEFELDDTEIAAVSRLLS